MKKIRSSTLRCKLLLLFGLVMLLRIEAQVPEEFLIWEHNSDAVNCIPVVDDTLVFYGDMQGFLYNVSLATGAKKWSFQTPHSITSKAIVEGERVFIRSGNRLFALNKETGEEIWSYASSDIANYIGGPTTYNHSAPVINEGIIYFGDELGAINGLNINNGELVFKYNSKMNYTSPDMFLIASTPVIQEDIIYFGDDGAHMYALSLNDSSMIWQQKVESPMYYGSIRSEIVLHDTLLFFGGFNNTISPLGKKGGKPVWSFTDGRTFIPSTPVFYENNVILGTTIFSNKIHSVNQTTGIQNWSTAVKGIYFVTPQIIRDSVLVINSSSDPFSTDKEGVLYLIDLNNGEIISHMHIPVSTQTSAVCVGQNVILGCNTGIKYFQLSPYYSKPGVTGSLQFDDSDVYISFDADQALDTSFFISNSSNFCQIVSIEGVTEGLSTSPISEKITNSGHVIPGKGAEIKIDCKENKLTPGAYVFRLSIMPEVNPDTILFEKVIHLTVNKPSIVNNIRNKETLSAYPNPFTNSLNFTIYSSCSEQVNLFLYSIEGKRVFSKEVVLQQGTNQINLGKDDLNSMSYQGVYFYSLVNKHKAYQGKIIRN